REWYVFAWYLRLWVRKSRIYRKMAVGISVKNNVVIFQLSKGSEPFEGFIRKYWDDFEGRDEDPFVRNKTFEVSKTSKVCKIVVIPLLRPESQKSLFPRHH